jgi:hypothetical protein
LDGKSVEVAERKRYIVSNHSFSASKDTSSELSIFPDSGITGLISWIIRQVILKSRLVSCFVSTFSCLILLTDIRIRHSDVQRIQRRNLHMFEISDWWMFMLNPELTAS